MSYPASYTGTLKVKDEEGLIRYLKNYSRSHHAEDYDNIVGLLSNYTLNMDVIQESATEYSFSGWEECFHQTDLTDLMPYVDGEFTVYGEDRPAWTVCMKNGTATEKYVIDIMPSFEDKDNIDTVTRWLSEQLNIDYEDLKSKIEECKQDVEVER